MMEERSYPSKSIQAALSNRNLELTIFPTEQCNFRCTYCYEDFSTGKMTPEIIAGIKDLITNRAADIENLRLGWFGGEPLLALDVMLEISHHANEICEKFDVNLLPGQVTTNGFNLTLPVAQELIHLKQSEFQISLDGTAASHDRTRKLISGRGTFERIFENILALKKSDLRFKILLRLHLLPHNVDSIENLIETLSPLIESDDRFCVLFKRVSNFGGPNATEIDTLEHLHSEELITKFKPRLNRNGKLNPRELKQQGNYICYASKPNSLLIRSNGSISKCTIALSDDFNIVGKLTSNGKIGFDATKMRSWMRGFESFSPEVLECPLNKFPEKEQAINFIPIKPAQ
ncbi:MAG: radical SAM protein [Paraburkholderia sp.]|uniref:radical SAM protein n=1 Tax=Paraburkholderia sp. TaxID=1926495 RepID=UPI00120926CF|nr:radical SAM protein [Paraburkholderia sp.]TAM04936.1 MAG: radical SAM protein [Paraburkholderia sp.]TAM29560.1 MAG: radical SAM protein [Paraburkholderia sp.]